MSEKPFVSIITPVFNNQDGLNRVLRAIKNQTYPADRFETIVIDNGSDISPKKITEENNAIYLEERYYLNSPYSARNRGLEVAKGEIIVLLDTTCEPVEVWLQEGVKAIQSGYDLVGGNVAFDVTKKSSLGDMYDSLVNIRMKESVLERNIAKTTNLFIHKRVFDSIGWFPEGLRSGGDVRWTGKCTNSGFKLGFSESAGVVMKTRGLLQLISKQYRVAKGMPRIWKEQGGFFSNLIKKGILFWLPPNPVHLMRAIDSGGYRFMKKRFLGLFLVGWFLRLVSGLGIWAGVTTDLSNQINNKNFRPGATRDC